MRMHRVTIVALFTVALLSGVDWRVSGLAQAPSPDEVLRRAAANEEKLRAVELEYTYRQNILVQTLGQSGGVSDELRRISDVIYDGLGNRNEKILEYPPSRLATALGVARPDFKSLLGVDLFFLTTESLPRYSVTYIEREKIDDINSFVFDVGPFVEMEVRE